MNNTLSHSAAALSPHSSVYLTEQFPVRMNSCRRRARAQGESRDGTLSLSSSPGPWRNTLSHSAADNPNHSYQLIKPLSLSPHSVSVIFYLTEDTDVCSHVVSAAFLFVPRAMPASASRRRARARGRGRVGTAHVLSHNTDGSYIVMESNGH